jgi:WD40 repeat protein
VENVRLAVWDAKTGKYISETRFSAVSIQVMKFSLDGSLLAIGSSSEVWVWDAESWQLIKRFSGHSDLIEDLAFTPDGTKILSASRDGTIRVWPLEG